jgi:hypothetical protein
MLRARRRALADGNGGLCSFYFKTRANPADLLCREKT